MRCGSTKWAAVHLGRHVREGRRGAALFGLQPGRPTHCENISYAGDGLRCGGGSLNLKRGGYMAGWGDP